MRKVLWVLVWMLGLSLGYLLLWPVPIAPQAWTPPAAPKLEGVHAKNEKLKAIQRLAEGLGAGPEGLSLDDAGRIYAGYRDGRVMQLAPDGANAIELANTGGRPLGTAVLPDGSVLVADADKGLLRIAADRKLTVLTAGADGVPFHFTDDLDFARQSPIVYFTDASKKFGPTQVEADFIEHAPNGRFLSYNLDSGQTIVLIRDLYFPNGVAMGPDDRFVLVNETATYRILRYWLKGEKAGQMDVFADNLPGFPDNIKFNGRDRFWCALYGPRSPDLDKLLPEPFLRTVLFRLPATLRPKPVKQAFALGFNLDGQVIANLQSHAPDAYAPITSVVEHGAWLYFGSLTEPAIGRMPLSAALAP